MSFYADKREETFSKANRRTDAAVNYAGPHADLLQQIVESAAQGNFGAAEHLLSLKSKESKSACKKAFYHALIHECAKAREPKAAGWCALKMVQAGIKPNTVTLNSIINAFAKVGDVTSAIAWWQQMPELGVEPNGITYNTVLHACARAGDGMKAEQWILQMTKDGFLPCIVSYSTVVNAFTKMGLTEKAEEWFTKMQAAGLRADAVIYNSLISTCAKDGLISKAEHWWSEMQRDRITPDRKTFNSMINACAKAGRADQAEVWFHDMERRGFQADKITFGSMIQACAKAGEPEQALTWVNEMMRRGETPNTVCFNTVLHVYARIGDYQGALKWFQRMLDANVAPSKLTYTGMIEASARAGNLSVTEAWVEDMVKNGFPVDDEIFMRLERSTTRPSEQTQHSPQQPSKATTDTYLRVVRACVSAGDAAAARSWLSKMVAVGCPAPGQLCKDVIDCCTRNGLRTTFADLLARAQASAPKAQGRTFHQKGPVRQFGPAQQSRGDQPAPRRNAPKQYHEACEQVPFPVGVIADSLVPCNKTTQAETTGIAEDSEPRRKAQLEDMWRRSQRLELARKRREKEEPQWSEGSQVEAARAASDLAIADFVSHLTQKALPDFESVSL